MPPKRCVTCWIGHIRPPTNWKQPGNRWIRSVAIHRPQICCRDYSRYWIVAARAAAWRHSSNRLRRARSSTTTGNCWSLGNPALLADDPQFAQFDDACQLARRRIERLGRLLHWIDRRHSTIDSEREIARLAGKLPVGYDPAIADRVQLALRRGRAYDKLLKSLPEPASDVAIAIAWKDLRDCGAQQFVAPRQAARIDLALARLPLLRALSEELKESLAPAEIDRRILQIWNDRLLEGCGDAEPWRERYRSSRRRGCGFGAVRPATRGNGVAHTRTDDDILQALVAANGRLRPLDETELRWLTKHEK